MLKTKRTYTVYNPVPPRKINNAFHNSVNLIPIIPAEDDNSGLMLVCVILTVTIFACVFIGLLVIL
jgi:hypothetical protein